MASVSTKVEVEGARQFKNDFQESARAVKAASAELKFFSNELNRNGASADALRNKLTALNKAYDSEGDAIAKLQARLDVLTEAGAENSDEFVKLTAELYKHKDAQSQIQSEIQDTTNQLDRFESGADEAGNEVSDLSDKAQNAGNRIGNSFAQDIAVATVFLNKMVDAAIEVAKAIWDIGKDAVMYNAQMESYSKTIEAFFKTSGQTAEEASKNTADLIANQKVLSSQIGIGADKLIDANKMLIASGVNGDKSQKAVSALAKAIVATGGGNEELSRMAQNLQQISNTGKASTQDMKQFAMAGVDIYGLMADSTGLTVDQLKEMDITFDMIVEALDSATQEGGKFFEASQVGATTLNGQMNTLKSTIQEGLGTAFQPVNEALTETLLPTAQKLVEEIDWTAVGQGIADGIARLSELMEKISEVVSWIEEQKMEEKGKGFVEDFASGMHNNNGLMNVAASTIMDSFTQEIAAERANATLAGMDTSEAVATGMAQGKSGVIGAAEDIQMSAFAVWNQTQQAEQYGADFVSGFATGMHRNNGLVASAAAAIARTIKSFLHFSRPDVGPLRDYENWMPDFVSGLANSMRNSEWMISDAAKDLAQTVNNSTTNNISMNVYGGNNDPNQIANVVMLKIQEATNRRSATWA